MNAFSWTLSQRPAGPWLGLQAAHDLGDEVAVGLLGEERVEDQAVGAPIGRQRDVGAVVADPGRERHGTGGVDGDVGEPPLDRLARCAASSITGHNQARASSGRSSPASSYRACAAAGSAPPGQRPDVQGVRPQRPARLLVELRGGKNCSMLATRAEAASDGVVGHGVAGRLGDDQAVGGLDRVVRLGRPAARPAREAAVVVLHRGQLGDVAAHRGVDVRCRAAAPAASKASSTSRSDEMAISCEARPSAEA